MKELKNFRWVFCILLIIAGVLLSLLENVLLGTIVVLLVLQFPVFIAGFTLGPLPGAVTGVFVPLLAGLVAGFPSWPMLPMMMAELMLYGLLCGLMVTRTKLPNLVILVIAMVAGRLGYLVVSLILPLVGTYVPDGISAGSAAIDGIPGILLQLIIIPPMIDGIEKRTLKGRLRYE